MVRGDGAARLHAVEHRCVDLVRRVDRGGEGGGDARWLLVVGTVHRRGGKGGGDTGGRRELLPPSRKLLGAVPG